MIERGGNNDQSPVRSIIFDNHFISDDNGSFLHLANINQKKKAH